jgi:polar amino acid transport system permease protein
MVPMSKERYRPTMLDFLILFAVTIFVMYLSYRIRTGIQYRWNWTIIPQYLFHYDQNRDRWVPNLLMQGFLTTIKISIWATLLSILLGTSMGILRTTKSLFNRLLSRAYVELIRNIPPLVLIFIFYFFISDQILSLVGLDAIIRSSSRGVQNFVAILFAPPDQLHAFISGLITLAIYEGAYITEIVRAGIESIEREQWDASYALGLSWPQVMWHVILPQSFQRILPALAGQLVSTIKDSAIVSIISIQELTFQGMELMSATYLTFEIWITITALYFFLTFTCSLTIRRMELYLQKHGTAYLPA